MNAITVVREIAVCDSNHWLMKVICTIVDNKLTFITVHLDDY